MSGATIQELVIYGEDLLAHPVYGVTRLHLLAGIAG
jgi:hypothetical protein